MARQSWKWEKIWWFYHLVASIVTNKEGNSDIANGDKKNPMKEDGELRHLLMSQ